MSYLNKRCTHLPKPLFGSDVFTSKIKTFYTILFLSSLLFTAKIFGQGGAANLDQIRNGTLGVYPTTPSADWVNGNAGPSNAHFAEGYSIPYRMKITGLSGNASFVNELIIEWDTKDQNGHAIDYLTHYQNLNNPLGSHVTSFGHGPEVVDPTFPTSETGFSGAPHQLFQILRPSSTGSEVAGQPGKSFDTLSSAAFTNNPDITKMAIWGGTILSMNYVYENNQDATTASTKSSLRIRFTATGSNALLAWGGHIAAEYDWGAGRGATGVNGSPYHMRLISLNGSGGNQDRSLKATAVIIPPPLCGISPAQYACPETDTLFYDARGSSTGTGISYVWTLTNGTNSAKAKISGSNSGFILKVVPDSSDFRPGGTFDLFLRVNKTGAESKSCSLITAGTIVKVVVTATANPTQIDLTVGNTSQLNTVLTGSDDTNTGNYTYRWTQSPASGGSLSDTTLGNPVFTAAVSAAPRYTFIVTATQKAAPNCVDTGRVVVDVTGAPPPCFVAGPSPICPSTTNTYFYDPNNNGTQDVSDTIPANFTAVWRLENNNNGATLNGDSTLRQVSVTASATCSSSYRVRLTLTSISRLLSASCFKDVRVHDSIPPTITYCPPDVVIECSASSDTSITGVARATDNCSVTITYRDAEVTTCYKTITRTWTATDPCGNTASCVQTIIKRDRTAPVIVCDTTGGATATDNCTSTTNIRLYSRDEGSTRTWTAIDEVGNLSTCTNAVRTGQRIASVETQATTVKQPVSQNLVTTISENVTMKPAVMAKPVTSAALARLNVKAFPNPFTNEVNFSIISPVSGRALLETYDMSGRKLGIIFQGNIEANTQRLIKYNVPALSKTPMTYRFSVGNLNFKGSLLPTKR